MLQQSSDSAGLPSAAPGIPDNLFLQVICKDMVGVWHPATSSIKANGLDMSAAQFEKFAGAGSQRKWKESVRIKPGQVEECPEGTDVFLMPASDV
jgi:hypothetical protein